MKEESICKLVYEMPADEEEMLKVVRQIDAVLEPIRKSTRADIYLNCMLAHMSKVVAKICNGNKKNVKDISVTFCTALAKNVMRFIDEQENRDGL